jgi:hypothetical protein
MHVQKLDQKPLELGFRPLTNVQNSTGSVSENFKERKQDLRNARGITLQREEPPCGDERGGER